MNVQEVVQWVEKVRHLRGDDEMAHVAEDALRRDLLKAIAGGECEDPAGCATEALKTEEIEFARWCA